MGFMYNGYYYGDDEDHEDYEGTADDLRDVLCDDIDNSCGLNQELAEWLDNEYAPSDLFNEMWGGGNDCSDIIGMFADYVLETVEAEEVSMCGVDWVDDEEGEE